jgi:hypothetical protein
MMLPFQRPVLWLGFLGLTLASVAQAHDPLQSWSAISLKTDGIEIETTMASYAAQSLLKDGDRRPPLTPDNFEDYLPEFQQAALNLFQVTAAGQPLAPKSSTVELTEEADIEFRTLYPPPGPGPWRFQVTYLDRMPEGFVASIFVEDNAHKSLAWDDLSVERTYLDVAPPSSPLAPSSPPATPTASAPMPAPAASRAILPSWKFMELGAVNMITGFGHLVFLCGLLAVCRSFRPAVAITACFALGHSISLAFAALNLVVLPSRLVDTLVAASIVFVGIENLARRDGPRGRWGTAFAFGIIHGLGFAQALKAAVVSVRPVPVMSLVSFDLGIELALIAVTAVFLFVLWKMRASPFFARLGLPVVSSVISVLGAYWLVRRTFFP